MGKKYVLRRFILVFLLSCTSVVYLASCETRRNAEPESKIDSNPAVTSVTILPENPHKGIELNSVVQGRSPTGSPITYKYQWIKNERVMIGENNPSLALKGDRFQKGDLIRVKVTATDGRLEGPPLVSAPVKIPNSTPVIQEAWIEPKVAYVYDSLKAQVKSSDADGDFVYFIYQWEKNGKVLPEERGQTLERGQFKKGDSIIVTVTPDDREIQGRPKKSASLVISNSPPIITSSPPISVSGTTYNYQVKVSDPDQDPITFTLKSGPKGMIIDKNTGLVQWEIKKEDKGNHSIEIEALDNEGAKSIQRFTLTVDIK